MRTRAKLLVVYICTTAFMIAALAMKKDDEKINFSRDYEIDLRQDYILVKDEKGRIDTVQHGKLENYLLKEQL